MFENLIKFLKNVVKKEEKKESVNSKDAAKERLHLVLMQDRANVSADFLELMKQEIIEVIKKYIEVDEGEIDVRLTNKENEDGTNGAPALYANIPILNIKNEARKVSKNEEVDSKNEIVEEISETEKVETSEIKEQEAKEVDEDKTEDINTVTENTEAKIENEKVDEEKVEEEKVEQPQ